MLLGLLQGPAEKKKANGRPATVLAFRYVGNTLQVIVLQMCVSYLLEKHVVDALDDAEPLVWVLQVQWIHFLSIPFFLSLAHSISVIVTCCNFDLKWQKQKRTYVFQSVSAFLRYDSVPHASLAGLSVHLLHSRILTITNH